MFGLGSRARARVGTIRCPRCKSSRMRKDGFDRSRNQMFECAHCGKKTSERHFSEFKGLRTNDHAVTFGIKLYLMGLSLRQTGYALGEMGVSISHVSVRNWILRFGHRCRQRLYSGRGEYGDTWYVDEMHVHRNGKKYYIWSVRDDKSQVIALWGSSHRDGASAIHLLKKAIRISGKEPEMIVSDGWTAYPPAIRTICPDAEHVRGHIGWEITNNMSESLYGTFLRSRFNALRNVKRCKFVNALLDLLQVWYVFERPHISFEGGPPVSQWTSA